MGSGGGDGSAGSLSVLVRPVVMLVIGLVAGVVMWRVLTADGGPSHAVGSVSAPMGARAVAGPFDGGARAR